MSTIIRISDCKDGQVLFEDQHRAKVYRDDMTTKINLAMMAQSRTAIYAKAKYDKKAKKFDILSFIKDQFWED